MYDNNIRFARTRANKTHFIVCGEERKLKGIEL